ncbi:MAG: M14 family metallopeptidase [Bacilli bacterium]
MRKIKLTLFGKIVFSLLFLFLIIILKSILFNKKDNITIISDYNDLNNSKNEFIVNTSETDNEIINTIFAKGMSVDDFRKIINQPVNYVIETTNYKKIEYDFDNKLHYSELEDMLLNLNNSDIVKLEIIGKSVDNRNIYGIEVGNGDKIIYIDANVHAAEIANTLILMKYIIDIVNSYESNDLSIIEALNTYKIVAIPTMNPDGYEVYNFGVESLNNKNLWWYQNRDIYNFENMKSNANGVDLNRNFPTQNAGLYYNGKSLINSVSLDKTTKSTTYFGGYSLGSEPETKAAMYFMLKHYKNTNIYINMHSQGRVIYAGKPNLSNEFNENTKSFANIISKLNGYIVYGLNSEEVGEGNDGSVTDFMAELANGFKFSSVTGRLTTNSYIDNSCKLVYSYPVITIETLKTYTTDPSVFKKEYYDMKIKDVLYSLIEE